MDLHPAQPGGAGTSSAALEAHSVDSMTPFLGRFLRRTKGKRASPRAGDGGHGAAATHRPSNGSARVLESGSLRPAYALLLGATDGPACQAPPASTPCTAALLTERQARPRSVIVPPHRVVSPPRSTITLRERAPSPPRSTKGAPPPRRVAPSEHKRCSTTASCRPLGAPSCSCLIAARWSPRPHWSARPHPNPRDLPIGRGCSARHVL